MPLTDPKINVSELRKTYREVFDAVSRGGKRYEVLCNGEVMGFIVGPAEWKIMNETLEILTNRDLMEQILRSMHFEEGDSRPAEVVFDEIESDLEKK